MSCEDCEREQEELKRIAYYRIENANVAIIGCRKHVKILIDKLNKGRFDE